MKYGLIGEHLSHSFSPEIHKIIGGYNYELCELPPDSVGKLLASRDFLGINVTIPYKQTVIPFLDEISPRAEMIGAVNTVVNRNGKLSGYNTDFSGMLELIKKPGITLAGKKVLILGTGGTSKTALAVCRSEGAGDIIRISRDPLKGVTYEDAYRLHGDADVIINTTPAGMFPASDECPADISRFYKLSGVIDAIYNPIRSELVLAAQEKKIPAEGGLYMLAAQAVYASALFLGTEPDPGLISKAFRAVLAERRNIVLIGMPSSGKSTVGKLLAAKLGKKFLDTDEITSENIGMSIPFFIQKNGEPAFRQQERRAVLEASSASGAIIATGGGAVLNPDNVKALRKNGILVFLDRSLKNLTPTFDRPLSSDKDKLTRMFSERRPVYLSAADIVINCDGSPEEAAENIIKEALK